MNRSASASVHPAAPLDTLVAELTRAAYHVVLRRRAADTWLDLELNLWQALTDTVMYLTDAATVAGDTLYVKGGAHFDRW
jgi:hypothetical protein